MKESSSSTAERPVGGGAETLHRELGFLGVFSLAAGAMISSGLFVLPGLAFAKAGPGVVVSYALAGVVMIPVMLAQTELATAMPRAGGSYFYIERSMGPLVGTLAGFANWLSIALKAAFALVGIGAIGHLLLPLGPAGLSERLWALIACAAFTVVNLLSSRHTGRLQVLLVVGLLGILVAYLIGGLGGATHVAVGRFEPFLPHGMKAMLGTAGMVFVSYGGLTKVASVSEEVRRPARNLPLGMFAAFIVVNALYVAVVFVTVGVLDADVLRGHVLPIYEGARACMGPAGAVFINVAAFLAFATTANGGLMAASRSPLAMSRDGLLPVKLAQTHPKWQTPWPAILVTAGFMIAVIAGLNLETLVKTASTMMILMFMLVNLAVIIMRQSGLQNYRPTFRTPFYPWIQIASLVAYVFLLFEMGALPLLLTVLFCLAALAWYFVYVGRSIQRESAFAHLVRRALAPDIRDRALEEELKQITIERDQIDLDRFDLLVTNARVLDLPDAMTAKEFFQVIAADLADDLGLSETELFERFVQREQESSTVLRPGLAVPHVIVPGEGIFTLLLVRCRQGITFAELNPPVTVAFVLVGSLDERNFHLRALMNIAHVIGEPDFDRRWQAAAGVDALRDVVLLSRRRRDKGSK